MDRDTFGIGKAKPIDMVMVLKYSITSEYLVKAVREAYSSNWKSGIQNDTEIHVVTTIPVLDIFSKAEMINGEFAPDTKSTKVQEIIDYLFEEIDFTLDVEEKEVLEILMVKYPRTRYAVRVIANEVQIRLPLLSSYNSSFPKIYEEIFNTLI